MSGVDIDAVNTGNFVRRVVLEVKGVEETALIEVQSINLMARSGNDCVTRGVVIGNRSTGSGYSCAVVEATLVVECNGTVVLKV